MVEFFESRRTPGVQPEFKEFKSLEPPPAYYSRGVLNSIPPAEAREAKAAGVLREPERPVAPGRPVATPSQWPQGSRPELCITGR